MDTLPHLTIHDSTVRPDRQQCALRASRIAMEYGKGHSQKQQNPALCKEESAIDEAKCILRVKGIPDPTEKEYIGQLVLTFGKYSNSSFKWLLENDVGYTKYLVDKHLKEKRNVSHAGIIRDGWLKDYLAKYVQFFPQVSSLLESNVENCTYGQGMFKSQTYSEMFDMYQQFKGFISIPQTVKDLEDVQRAHKAYNEVRKWLCTAQMDISSVSIKRFRLYIKERDTAVVKKLSGAGRNTAEWFTSIANEHCQIVSFVLTCEESTAQLKKMTDGVIRRYEQGSQPVPLLMYVDCGCCRAHVPNAVENMFVSWVDGGMVIRLDIWHRMHRFAAAVRTESHPKYELLMSALSAAVLAYNRDDLDLVIKATRAKSPDQFTAMSDKDLLGLHIAKETLKHYVRRVTIGAQETYRLMEIAIQELKGPAGLDENGISLFKSSEAIDGVWANQQKHLECIQDPPGMSLYRVVKTSVINGGSLPYYKCERGSSSLEGFHKFLPYMIPGPHCAARPFQVYLISGIARWNADRAAESVYGKKGRNNRIYSSPLIQRLNSRCKDLFG